MEYELTAPFATIIAAGIALVSALVVAVLSAFIARVLSGRDRRRQMYGEAFRVALEWREMVYRVRRRDNTTDHNRALIDRFHDLQERLDYYEGWIGSESRYMRRSFMRLVAAVKDATKADLQAAWNAKGKSGNADPDDHHPQIELSAMDNYLRDVRSHLSLQPWRWVAVWWRNEKDGQWQIPPNSSMTSWTPSCSSRHRSIALRAHVGH